MLPAALPTRSVLFLIVLVIFSRLYFAEFSWYDDPVLVHHNPSLNPPTVASISRYWTSFDPDRAAGYYIPLTYTVWGVLARVSYLQTPGDFGIHLNPWVFHAANVVVHGLSTIVVFSILRLLIKNDIAAVIGAMLFALHPVQVQAVAWVSAMKDLLSGLLALTAIWQYFKRTKLSYTLATIAMLASTLAKPSAIVTPLIVLCIDVLVERRRVRDSIIALLPWFVLTVPAVVLTKLGQPSETIPVAPVWARPIIALDSIGFYLAKLVAPLGLTVDYGRTPVWVFNSAWFWISWMVPLLMMGALVLNRKRRRDYLAAAAVFAAGLLTVLGFTPFLYQKISGVADHYIYLSMLGPALAAAVFVAAHPTRRVIVGAVVILALLAAVTVHQTGYWHDDVRLFSHNIKVNPDSGLAHVNLGAAFERAGDHARAEHHYREALRIDPADDDARLNLKDVLNRQPTTLEAP